MKNLTRTIAILSAICMVGVASPVWAATQYTILTGPNKKSTSYEYAKTQANDKDIFAVSGMRRALKKAHSLASSCGTCTIHVKVAQGSYSGRGGSAPQWKFPELEAPKVTLRILGGYNDDFSVRNPFVHKVEVFETKGRTDAVFTVEAKKSKLKELVFSGFMIDVGDGNNYNSTNMMKGSSPSVGILRFGYLQTEKLVIADNVFMNGAHGVAAPLIRAANKSSQVIVRNNIILNNIFAWQVKGPSQKTMLDRYIVEGNSFILNWPYNPDPTTSNPGTLEIGNNYTANKVVIKDNMFAYNVGGAIFPQWSEDRGPKMEIKHNLFYGNGALFGVKDTADGAFVGKFTGGGRHLTFDIETIEEEFDWESEGNASFNPKLNVPKLDIKVVGYHADDKTQMSVGGDEAEKEDEQENAAASDDLDIDIEMPEGMELDIEIDSSGIDGDVDISEEENDSVEGTEDDTKAEVEDDVLADLGDGLDISDDFGGGVDDNGFSMSTDIQNYAKRFARDNALLFPANAKAKAFGASPDRVVQYK